MLDADKFCHAEPKFKHISLKIVTKKSFYERNVCSYTFSIHLVLNSGYHHHGIFTAREPTLTYKSNINL